MEFIGTPLTFQEIQEDTLHITRDISQKKAMIDNLVELLIFTPKGSFTADPDFGFEYWNHEYANVDYWAFNNGHTGYGSDYDGSQEKKDDVSKKECQEGLERSLAVYAPQLMDVNIAIELNNVEMETSAKRKIHSRCMVTIVVEGSIGDGLNTRIPYKKEVVFLMEPTVKRIIL